jgi:hypothetical protein
MGMSSSTVNAIRYDPFPTPSVALPDLGLNVLDKGRDSVKHQYFRSPPA